MFKVQGVKMLSNAIKLEFDDYYNCENRLVKMLSETVKLEFVYDYKGRRVSKQVFAKNAGVWTLTTHKKFVYNKYKLIKEVDALTDSIKQQFTWLGDNLLSLHENNNSYLYIADGNKNITQLINLTTGTTANRYDYTPFGKLINKVESVENPFKFSSEYHDTETNLIYYNYRYYNPQTGKWLSRDPIGEKGGGNLYTILKSDPINSFDLLGLRSPRVKKEKCTVVLFWGHGGDTRDALDNFNKNDRGCAVASGLGCRIDGRNIGNGIGDNKDKSDSDFPDCNTGYTGISDRSADKGGNAGENDMTDKNIATRSSNGFAKLMVKAWKKAVDKGLSMAADCKCGCKIITVEFRGSSHTNENGNKILDMRYKSGDDADDYKKNPGRNVSKGGVQIVNKYPKQGSKHRFRCKKNAKK